MTPKDVEKTKSGSCHDQVFYEIDKLKKAGLNPHTWFLMEYKGQQGRTTHSTVTYRKGDSWYWFENAWENLKGLHKFSTESAMMSAIVNAFAEEAPKGYDIHVNEFDPSKHRYGEDLGEFVETCLSDIRV